MNIKADLEVSTNVDSNAKPVGTLLTDDLKIPRPLLDVIKRWDINIPPQYWYAIVVEEHNSEEFYRFKHLLEHPKYKGFFYIPYYTRYCVSVDGKIIDAHTGKLKKWYATKPGCRGSIGGYRYTRVFNGEYRTNLARHRALCLTFKRYKKPPSSLVVNHKNGTPGDDRLTNISWSTPSENNQHAYDMELRPNAQKAILHKNLATGTVTRYASISECAKKLGHGTGTLIWWRITRTPDKVYPDLDVFKLDDGCPWPEFDVSNIEWVGRARPAQARNVFTGEVIDFVGLRRGEELTGVQAGTISSHLQHRNVIPHMGYNFRYVDWDTPWPEHSSLHLELYRHNPSRPTDGVYVTNLLSSEETFYPSITCAAQALKTTVGNVRSLITKNLLYRKTYKLRYFRLRG